MSKNYLREKFKNPKMEFRSAPFWSWNDELKDKELQKQIDEMKKGGLGGFFMHSRIGLITPYFSKEWMKRIKHTVEYSKKKGMLAYLYDEDRWPSGFAGGKIPKKGKSYRKQGLELTKKDGKWVFRKVIGERLPNIFLLSFLMLVITRKFVTITGNWLPNCF